MLQTHFTTVEFFQLSSSVPLNVEKKPLIELQKVHRKLPIIIAFCHTGLCIL